VTTGGPGTRRLTGRPLAVLATVLILGCTPRPVGEEPDRADDDPPERVELRIEERIEVRDGS
jgi:hypothetical protein